MRLAALVFLVALATATRADDPRVIEDVTTGEAHENGVAHWNSVVFRSLSAVCGLTGADRLVELGDKAAPAPRIDAEDCTASSVWIHNTTGKPIYCHARLDLAQADDSGRTQIEGEHLVMPESMEMIVTAYGDSAHLAVKPTSSCELRVVAPTPAPPCEAKFLTFPDVDSYYPAASRRRDEQGDVVLEFRIDSAARKVRDVRVSQGSGYRELDLAALKASREISATTNCPELRRKVKIKFRLAEDPPPPADKTD